MVEFNKGEQPDLLESDQLPLGKAVSYPQHYDPSVLYPVPREINRIELGIEQPLPFYGEDLWTAFELSWLNLSGMPQVAVAEFVFPCNSSHIVESKSLKLYLNSFNHTQLSGQDELRQRLIDDLSATCGAQVAVELFTVSEYQRRGLHELAGRCLDDLEINCSIYHYSPQLLTGAASADFAGSPHQVFTHLFKSNCLITGQPDWASLSIEYQGVTINEEQLLQYLISFRNHNEFHEQCVERIFTDLMSHCQPTKLLVFARFTRRGGLDINPWRANCAEASVSHQTRVARQ